MRILIVAYGRTGGTTLAKWIGAELNYKVYNEPYINEKLNEWDGIETENNIVVRMHGGEWRTFIEKYKNDTPPYNFLKLWDKVIGVYRENSYEAGISAVRANETKEWHRSYYVTNKWIESKKEQIDKFSNLKESQKIYVKKNIIGDNSILVSYEGIYIEKTDINKIKEFLNITNSKFDNLININNRYRKNNKIVI